MPYPETTVVGIPSRPKSILYGHEHMYPKGKHVYNYMDHQRNPKRMP